MEQLPLYIPVLFGLTVLLAGWLFAKATPASNTFLIVLAGWITFQSIVGLTGFYTVNTVPPRFLLLLIPPTLTIVALMSMARGKTFIDQLDIRALTLFHVVRIPVEIVLLWLFMHKTIPELMTFEGRNFDIISGLSAPFVYRFGFAGNRVNKPLLLIWNLVCLVLVVNIVVNALLSAPTPFQQFAFEQPNIAIGYFPFNLLPSCLVPLVILAHLVTIRQLLSKEPVSTKQQAYSHER
ncbi:hypothetical protein [Spirosoma linguale]|uniref:Uncharacterized protein n=1 Tax=Spirosoma linguale (strain ATCC 33905 / DSM 74 / LMG 10896 / Claus 1) TaxID=504472 RepID=D2QPU8_SPILD|nr:hypothetical protein Slin_1634 [Spirosoma linguale DSM 74]